MELKDVRDILIQEGKNPDDYTIKLLEQGYTIILKTPEEKARDELKHQLAENTIETLELISALNELQKIEQAQSNAELIELMLSLQGGM